LGSIPNGFAKVLLRFLRALQHAQQESDLVLKFG